MAASEGVVPVLVNGVETISDGVPTAARGWRDPSFRARYHCYGHQLSRRHEGRILTISSA
jgi:hypothetical protein